MHLSATHARRPLFSGALLLFLVDVYIFILMGSVIVPSEIEGGKTTQHTACTKNGKQISIVKGWCTNISLEIFCELIQCGFSKGAS